MIWFNGLETVVNDYEFEDGLIVIIVINDGPGMSSNKSSYGLVMCGIELLLMSELHKKYEVHLRCDSF